ncbi:hypothetical protein HED51_15465 [Ochrobactrum grignonense]|nr:hypothetical protein [Brucella grignonensis]
MEIIDAFLGEVFISNSEIMKIDDTWGGSPNPRVVIQGGVIKPWYVTAADGLPVMKSDLILLGVGVYAPVKADNTLGTFSLNSAKGMGNFMLSGAKLLTLLDGIQHTVVLGDIDCCADGRLRKILRTRLQVSVKGGQQFLLISLKEQMSQSRSTTNLLHKPIERLSTERVSQWQGNQGY